MDAGAYSDERPEGAPEEQLRQLLRRGGERFEVFDARAAPFRVSPTQRRRDDLLQDEQAADDAPFRIELRLRGSIPKRCSRAQAATISTSRSG